MDPNANAEAIADAEAVPATPTVEQTEDELLEQAYERAHSDDTPEEPDTDEPPADEPQPAEDEAPEFEWPSTVPTQMREALAGVAPEVRDAVLADRDKLRNDLSSLGREAKTFSGIKEGLVGLVQQNPEYGNMAPEQVLQHLTKLDADIQQLRANPIETMVQFARENGLQDKLGEALGQPVAQEAQHIAQLQQHIRGLEAKLSQVADPEYLRQQVSQFTSEGQIANQVNEFAQGKEHWDKVEAFMPDAIRVVQSMPGDSQDPTSILERAYNMVLQQAYPDAVKAEAQPAPPVAADPDKVARARQAKSLNVSGTSTGKTRELSEDELLSQAYDRAMG